MILYWEEGSNEIGSAKVGLDCRSDPLSVHDCLFDGIRLLALQVG
jgi:hypothetical protein